MKRSLFAAVIVTASAWALSPSALASQWVGTVVQSVSGGVTINLFTWYSFPKDVEFRMVHEAEALDVVRGDLIRRGRLRDLPLLTAGPSENGRRNSIGLRPDCAASYGAAEGPQGYRGGRPLGECYVIGVADARMAFQDHLVMAAALPELTPGIPRMEITDLPAFRAARSTGVAPYSDLALHFDPIWSPDGERLVYTAWRDGATRFEILAPASGSITRLESLEQNMAARPIWSPDSRFVAYAGLDAVKVYDVRTRTTRTFRRAVGASSGTQTMIEFEGTRLRFAFDRGEHEGYIYDTVDGGLDRLPAGSAGHFGDDALNLDRHASLQPARSPDGRWIALFTFVKGQRRIQTDPLR